jgi:hypothetical protein
MLQDQAMHERIPALGLVALFFILFAMPVNVSAYEESTVVNGATITGRVIFKGPVPPPRPFGLIVYPDMDLCERISDGKGHRLLRDFSISENGGFQDVVVAVQNVARGKPFPRKELLIGIKDCEFRPFISVVRDGETMSFLNHDDVIHDIQTYSIVADQRGDRIFDRAALPNSLLSKAITLPGKSKIVWIQCGKHSFMQSWSYGVDNPYYAITGPDGRFSIKDLPPGRYRVTAWHPFMKLREEAVDLSPNSREKIDFEFGK